MSRFIAVVLSILLALSPMSAAKPRDMNKVKSEKQATAKAIKETSKKITVNERETKRQLNRLTTLKRELSAKESEIVSVRASIDSVDTAIRITADSIAVLEQRVSVLQHRYVSALRKMQGNSQVMNTLGFLFSSATVKEAYGRIRYLHEFAAWRKRRVTELGEVSAMLRDRHAHLGNLHKKRETALSQLGMAQRQLENKRSEVDRMVAKLKKEGGNLRTVLKQKERQLAALDRELERLIAAEQKRREEERKREERKKQQRKESKGKLSGKETVPGVKSGVSGIAEADRILNGNFESNKGRLLFPVSGSYKIVRGFGRQKHPELEHVETENSGIDIEVKAGTSVRSIFSGKVSAIFKLPGFNTVVMIRHGSYLSIYANLGSISVKKDDDVKANQTIGKVYADPDDSNRAILHFELRKEQKKLNPLLWVK